MALAARNEPNSEAKTTPLVSFGTRILYQKRLGPPSATNGAKSSNGINAKQRGAKAQSGDERWGSMQPSSSRLCVETPSKRGIFHREAGRHGGI
jgi:hypothetical protein